MVGAGHVMIINKNKGGSLFMTHLMAIASFLLVLYSTFLTRSGILGNSSVHAFTDLGMQGQLVIYVLTFVMICVVLLIHDKLIRVSYIMISLMMLFFGITMGYKIIILLAPTLFGFRHPLLFTNIGSGKAKLCRGDYSLFTFFSSSIFFKKASASVYY